LFSYSIKLKSKTIANVFFVQNDEELNKTLKNSLNTKILNAKKTIQLTSFHILKKYRGIGTKWLKEEIFQDLINNGYETVIVKSSHYKAFPLYERLGTKIGEYVGISDNKQYQRLGNIYEISLIDKKSK
jgi:hypothetical protein